MKNFNLYAPGQKVLAKNLNEDTLHPLRVREDFTGITLCPYESGLLYHPEFSFQLEVEGNSVVLKALCAILLNGHLVRYNSNNRDYGPPLAVDTSEAAPGEYYVYFFYEGRYIPWISHAAHGNTQHPDVRVPAYRLELRSEVQSIIDFPNALLVGKVSVLDVIRNQPSLEKNVYPQLGHLGAHAVGIALLTKTQANWEAMKRATDEIYRQLRSIPSDSVFIDLRAIAEQFRSFTYIRNAEVRHWNEKTSLFTCFKLWSDLANVFCDFLILKKAARRPGDALTTLYQAAITKGEPQIERYLLPALEACAYHCFDPDNHTGAIDCIEAMIEYVAYSWNALGDGAPIQAPQGHLPQPNRY